METLTSPRPLVERIRAYVVSLGISNRKLAERAGVAITTVRNVRRQDWNPTMETVEKLSAIIPPDWPSQRL